MLHDPDCKHDEGFTFHKGHKYPGLWVCSRLCGFFLNFSPETFPRGVAYVPDGYWELHPELKSEIDERRDNTIPDKT